MGKLRFFLALWAAKLSVPALKLTHHQGSNYPGQLAIRLCPDFLKYVGKPAHIIAVTGTNGKTTVVNLIMDTFAAEGRRVLSNRAGSNINTGIATSLALGAGLSGKSRYDWAVFEVDERWSPKIYPYVKPDYLLITNLSRDSVPRNAHPAFIAGLISQAVPAGMKLILNGDDLISCSVAPENPRVHFGIAPLPTDTVECRNRINDMQICPKCQGKLLYEYRRYSHIGRAKCTLCGFCSPEYDYTLSRADFAAGTILATDSSGSAEYPMMSDSKFNLYNQIAVIALFRELGWSHKKIQKCAGSVHIVKTRYDSAQAGGMHIVMQMSKDMNAYACSRAFEYVTALPGEKEVVLMLRNSNDIHDQTENICWLADCDFELLRQKNISRIVIAGRRSRDIYLRLLIAGVEEAKLIRIDEEKDIPDRLEYASGKDIYLFYGTDALDLVQSVRNEIVMRAERGTRA